MSEKIVREVAEAEFDRFTSAMDIDVDPTYMDAEDKKGFEQQREKILAAIQIGSVVINDDGEPEFTPTGAGADVNAIVFHEPTGASLMAMDRKKKTEDIGKLYATMSDMTKTSAGLFSKMKMRDLKICMAITTIFLG